MAYGSSAPTLTVTLDGTEIFSGAAPVTNSDLPSGEIADAVNFGSEAFSWTAEDTFEGTQALSVTVTGSSPFLMGMTKANKVWGDAPPGYDRNDPTSPQPTAAADTVFGPFYNVYNAADNTIYSDPLSDVQIDGVNQTSGGNPGQHFWVIPAGSTFTATVNVRRGALPDPV